MAMKNTFYILLLILWSCSTDDQKTDQKSENPVYLDSNGITVKAHEWAAVGSIGTINSIAYTVVDRPMLRSMIAREDNLSLAVTTKVTDMSELFAAERLFNQNIGNWDVSNVTTMLGMFRFVKNFNQDIGAWNVSNVTRMDQMFYGALSFNQDISNWDVGNVTSMYGLFWNTPFNQDIGDWNVSKVIDMYAMFSGNEFFNQDISSWNVSNVNRMSSMFYRTPFNQDLSDWNTDAVIVCTHFAKDATQWVLPKPKFPSCNP